MTHALENIEAGDAELIAAVRAGDNSAYAVLYERHVGAARRLARQLVAPTDADDLVAEAFTKVLQVLQRGAGPDVAFRAYLLTSVRRLHVDKIRASSKVHSTDDLTPFEPGVPFVDTAVEGFENEAAAAAFRSLPERWQVVLWHTEVEGQKPADIAPLLGMTPNSVAALAYRAREGLRQAFLTQHANELETDGCRWTHQHLGGYVREGLSRRDQGKVRAHLDDCRSCTGIYLELVEVNSSLAGILAPLLLGAVAGTAYLASIGGLAGGVATGTLAGAGKGSVTLFDRAKDAVLANAGVSAAAAVASVAVLTGATVLTMNQLGGGEQPKAQKAPVTRIQQSAPTETPGPADAASPTRVRNRADTLRMTLPAPSQSPTAAASPSIPAPPAISAAAEEPTERPSKPSGPRTPAPSTFPSWLPDPKPSKDPSPSTEPTTPPEPSGPATPTLPIADLAVTRSDSGLFEQAFAVSGLPATGTATVTISWSSSRVVILSTDSRCASSSETSLSCRVTDATPIGLTAVALHDGITLTAAVTSVDVDDPNPANNTVSVVLD